MIVSYNKNKEEEIEKKNKKGLWIRKQLKKQEKQLMFCFSYG